MKRRNHVQAAVAATPRCSRAAWKSWPRSISSVPSARIAAFFSLFPCGTTTAAGISDEPPRIAIDCPWLPRVARPRSLQPARVRRRCVEVDEAAAKLEGADRRVVLVFDPHGRYRVSVEQRPTLLRRRRHRGIHDLRRSFEIRQAVNHTARAPQMRVHCRAARADGAVEDPKVQRSEEAQEKPHGLAGRRRSRR